MPSEINHILFIACLFMLCLGISYLLARLIYSGPIKLTEYGTKQYILRVIAVFLFAVLLTILLIIHFDIKIDFKSIFYT